MTNTRAAVDLQVGEMPLASESLHASPAKPRLSYAEVFGWEAAFQKVKEGQVLKGWKVIWKHTEPDWLQVKDESGQKRMVRKGDALLLELVS